MATDRIYRSWPKGSTPEDRKNRMLQEKLERETGALLDEVYAVRHNDGLMDRDDPRPGPPQQPLPYWYPKHGELPPPLPEDSLPPDPIPRQEYIVDSAPTPRKEPHRSMIYKNKLWYGNAGTPSGFHAMTPGKSYNFPRSTNKSRVYKGIRDNKPSWEDPNKDDPDMLGPYHWSNELPYGPPPGMFYPPNR